MAFNMKKRHLLSLVHHTEREIKYLLDLSRDLKRAKYAGTEQQTLKGKKPPPAHVVHSKSLLMTKALKSPTSTLTPPKLATKKV